MRAERFVNAGGAKVVRAVVSLFVLGFGGPVFAAVSDCKTYQHAATLPVGFEEDGNALLKPLPGMKAGPEITYYSNGVCVCATVAPEPYHNFPGTPKDATLSCVTEKEYRAMLPSGVK